MKEPAGAFCRILIVLFSCTSVVPVTSLYRRRWEHTEAGWSGFLLLPSASVNHPRNVCSAERIKSKKVAGSDLVQLTDTREGVG